jgi:hypothetical protein
VPRGTRLTSDVQNKMQGSKLPKRIRGSPCGHARRVEPPWVEDRAWSSKGWSGDDASHQARPLKKALPLTAFMHDRMGALPKARAMRYLTLHDIRPDILR